MAISLTSRKSVRHIVLTFVALTSILISGFAQSKEGNALILTAKGEAFSQVVSGLTGDMEDDLSFTIIELEKASKTSDIKTVIQQSQPKVVILIGNNSINLYTQYQKENPDEKFPPSIALAALFVDKFIENIKNASGIRYEIPAVTSLVNMRSLMKKPINSVGVIHREWMSSLINVNRKYLEAEGIKLVSIVLPNKDDDMNAKLKSAIEELKSRKVDAIWVLNDNELLNSTTVGQLWIPQLAGSDLPVLVGVKPLLNTKFNFGSFAVVPDHYALGVQAASILYELIDEDWELGDREITQPISVKKIVNVSVLDKKSIPYDQGKLQEMDEVIK